MSLTERERNDARTPRVAVKIIHQRDDVGVISSLIARSLTNTDPVFCSGWTRLSLMIHSAAGQGCWLLTIGKMSRRVSIEQLCAVFLPFQFGEPLLLLKTTDRMLPMLTANSATFIDDSGLFFSACLLTSFTENFKAIRFRPGQSRWLFSNRD